MKIIDVCAFYSPRGGGVKTYVEQKLSIGPKLGHEIVVVVPGDSNGVIERGPGARIVMLQSPRFPLDRNYGYFAEAEPLHALLDAEQPDFVEATSPWKTASLVADWRGTAPRSLVMHADPLSAYAYRWFGPFLDRPTIDRQFSIYWEHLRRNGRKYDVVVCANHDLSSRLAAGGVANIATIPMGVMPGVFSPAVRDEQLRAHLLEQCGLPASAALLLGAGRLAPEKRWPLVIDAANAAGQDRPIGLVLLGEGREHRTIIRHIAGNPHVRVFEPERNRQQFARLMASADALIHGCEAETYCMTAAEARASGVPVIVPDAGGAADHARNGGGETFAANDAADAARAIRAVVDRGRPGIAAARTIDQHFHELFDRYRGHVRAASQTAASARNFAA